MPALKDLESGLSNKEVAKNFGVPKNTIFPVSNFFTSPMEVRDSGCRLYNNLPG